MSLTPDADDKSRDATRTCRVCGHVGEMTSWQLNEVMFGSFEPFAYQLCASCGSLQIERIPSDLSRHYPANYYSIRGNTGSDLIHRIRSGGLRHSAGGWSVFGMMLKWVGRLPSDSIWLEACKPSFDARILDVGCGRGDRLRELALAGFGRLKGVDPFVAADTEAAPGVPIVRGTLGTLKEEFDLIMMHHSLEHVAAPRETMSDAARLLSNGGKLLVRIPVMGSWAWRNYGIDWVQLDAPRHLHLITEKGVASLAASCGLHVRSVVYDSFDFQFYGSEQVRRARAGARNGEGFTKQQIREYKKKSVELNRQSDGDQACFVLTKAA